VSLCQSLVGSNVGGFFGTDFYVDYHERGKQRNVGVQLGRDLIQHEGKNLVQEGIGEEGIRRDQRGLGGILRYVVDLGLDDLADRLRWRVDGARRAHLNYGNAHAEGRGNLDERNLAARIGSRDA